MWGRKRWWGGVYLAEAGGVGRAKGMMDGPRGECQTIDPTSA